MEKYLAHRIEGGHLDYSAVVKRYPKYKKEIDRILTEEGYQYLIVNGNEITINETMITIANNNLTIG